MSEPGFADKLRIVLQLEEGEFRDDVDTASVVACQQLGDHGPMYPFEIIGADWVQPADRRAFIEMLGEGFHTAFRKAIDSPTAMDIHRLISAMDGDDWAAVLGFVADGFEISGWSFTRKVDAAG